LGILNFERFFELRIVNFDKEIESLKSLSSSSLAWKKYFAKLHYLPDNNSIGPYDHISSTQTTCTAVASGDPLHFFSQIIEKVASYSRYFVSNTCKE